MTVAAPSVDPTAPDAARAAFDRWRGRVASDPLADDAHLVHVLRGAGHADALETLRPFARRCATALDAWAIETNLPENLPSLRRWSATGVRTESVVFHPLYDAIGRETWATGVMARYATPGQEVVSLATAYLLGQNGEAGHCCPLACTAGMIKVLQAAPGAPPAWLERLLDPAWEGRWHASQFLTEVQGGSDVGANALRAVEGPPEALADGVTTPWRLYGEKWFCSVIDARLFLVTARPEGARAGTAGLTAFVVPRSLPHGAPNGFTIRRLKDKLGTRSMASAEVDFVGALALPVADFRLTLDLVLNTSRLYNAVVAAGVLQRAWREAAAYAAERRAFGSRLLDLPTIARVVANLRTEAHAARGLSFALAEAADRAAVGRADPGEPEARRFLVNCNKIWTATTCPAGVRSAIEVLGGNGAIEAFSVLPRLLRDAIVLEAWEGGHGVLCAQLLRDAQRLGLHRPAFAWLRRQPGADLGALDEQQSRFERVIVRPDAEAHIRDAVESLRPVAQAACLDPARDPVESAARRHLLVTNARGWDPLEDPDLSARVATLAG